MTAATAPRRFRAFISYSHTDSVAARWLHRRLETFAMPQRLVGRAGLHGPVPARLAPIFKDREDLPAADDLTAEVRTALSASACLVVLATPAAAASHYVDQEIALFRAEHPDRPILVALWAGDPDAAFPAALRRTATGASIEPLAADFRKTGDGRRLALLKLVAGISGVELDALVQREAQRRLRRVMAVTVAAVIGMLAMGLLTAFAFSARAEAERQRGEAEGLVEFMLTDLRDNLKAVGRLDVLTSANTRALAYYEAQQLGELPPAALDHRAAILDQMGKDNETRGDLAAALANYREAHRTTSAQLAADPGNPDRIFAAAQSEYWLGHVDEMRGDFAAARRAYVRYREAARRLMAVAPDDPRAASEMAYAENNIGIIALNGLHQPRTAIASFATAERWFASAVAHDPGNSSNRIDHANCLGWLADAELAAGDTQAARQHRLADRAIKLQLLAAEPGNRNYIERLVVTERALAAIDTAAGNQQRAAATLAAVAATMATMIADDPRNADYREQAARIGLDRAGLHLDAGRRAEAAALLHAARAVLAGPTGAPPDNRDRRTVARRIDALAAQIAPVGASNPPG